MSSRVIATQGNLPVDGSIISGVMPESKREAKDTRVSRQARKRVEACRGEMRLKNVKNCRFVVVGNHTAP